MLLEVDRAQPPLFTVPPPNPRARHGGMPVKARPLAEPLTARTEGPLEPRPYRILQNIRSISCCLHNNAAVDNDGVLWTWGAEEMGMYGGMYTYEIAEPSYVPQKRADHVRAVSAGAWHTVYITENGELWGWGHNEHGQLATDDMLHRREPIHIMDGVRSACANNDATFVIREDGSLWGWGANYTLRGSLDMRIVPVAANKIFQPVHIMDGVSQASIGEGSALVIKEDGTLWGWGDYITEDTLRTPTFLMEDMAFAAVPALESEGYCMAVAQNGDLYSFGLPVPGSMVNWMVRRRHGRELPIKTLEGVEKVVCGHYFTLILLRDGQMFSSGENGCGQCGTGRSTGATYKPVFSMPNAKDAGAGVCHGIGLQTNGDLWIWGGDYGLPRTVKETSNSAKRPM